MNVYVKNDQYLRNFTSKYAYFWTKISWETPSYLKKWLGIEKNYFSVKLNLLINFQDMKSDLKNIKSHISYADL